MGPYSGEGQWICISIILCELQRHHILANHEAEKHHVLSTSLILYELSSSDTIRADPQSGETLYNLHS